MESGVTLPLQVDVTCGHRVIRPTVGILAYPDWTLRELLRYALHFQDRYVKAEAEVLALLEHPVNVCLKDKHGKILCSVLPTQSLFAARWDVL